MKFTLYLFCLFVVTGCDQFAVEAKVVNDEWCLPEGGDKILFEPALDKANIKFTRNADCYAIDVKYREQVDQIQNVIFKAPLMAGLSVSRSKIENKKLVEKLRKHGVVTYRMPYQGREFVAWPEADADEVEHLLDLTPEQLKHMREMRRRSIMINGDN